MVTLSPSPALALAAAVLAVVLLVATATAVPLAHAQRPRSICGPLAPPGSMSCKIRCVRADPVCGVDGVTYTCGCPEANCKRVPVVYKGACMPRPPPPPSDICGGFGGGGPAIDRPSCEIRCIRADPVCGVNGVTYWCGCPEAACKGVRVVKKGAC